MKKLLLIMLAAILILSMAACSHDTQPEQVSPPGSNGPSKPTSTEPPVLVIGHDPTASASQMQYSTN